MTRPFPAEDQRVATLLRIAIDEDLGSGDLTTLATVDPGILARGALRFRDPGITAGLAIFNPLVDAFYSRGKEQEEAASLAMSDSVGDGARVSAGATVCTLTGTARALLMIERTFLNFVARLSGIATLTRAYVDAVVAVGASVRVLDTRKTTPGWRVLEKYAVTCGSGTNHRFGLYDAVLIKDNHIQAAGSIGEALRRVFDRTPDWIDVVVECDTLAQVTEALDAGADALLLDNFPPAQVEEAVALVGGRARIEVSGGVNLETVAAYARSGVNDISIGRLTHSAPALDVTFDLELDR